MHYYIVTQKFTYRGITTCHITILNDSDNSTGKIRVQASKDSISDDEAAS